MICESFFVEDSPWVYPVDHGEFRNLISARIIPLAGSEQLTGRLINICRISLRALVREWNTGTRHETGRTPLWKEIGEPCPGWSVSRVNISCLSWQYYATRYIELVPRRLYKRHRIFRKFILLIKRNSPKLIFQFYRFIIINLIS